MSRKNIITIILALVLSTSAHAIMPDVFQGRVLDAETQEPLEGVHVEITEIIPGWAQSDEVQYTDSLGRYRFRCGGMTNMNGQDLVFADGHPLLTKAHVYQPLEK